MSDGLRDAIAAVLRDEYGETFVFASDVAVLDAVRGYLTDNQPWRVKAMQEPLTLLGKLVAADRVVGLRQEGDE